MLVTRTIRRKMLFSLAVLALFLGAFVASSYVGLCSYERTVEDLELSIKRAPRKADLVSALSSLTQAFSIDVPPSGPDRQRAAQLQAEEFLKILQTAREEVQEFQRRLEETPTAIHRDPRKQVLYNNIFQRVERIFDDLEGEGQCLSDVEHRAQHVRRILVDIGNMVEAVRSIDDPSLELIDRLKAAEREKQFHTRLVRFTGIGGLILFLAMIFFGYQWIFAPISRVHQGAIRVAEQDDFDFRIESHTNDEISELAQAFNKMTARFQAVTEDLESQVEQRSRQLVQSERMAGVGFLSAGVAHEINNPLSAIVGAADSLDWRLSEYMPNFSEEDRDVIREYLDLMQSEAQRCRQITEKLLSFARGSDSERNQYDITAIIQEVVAMTHLLGRFRDREVTVSRTTPCYAWVNGPEIKQVLLNLIANALESTEPGGHVEIRIEEGHQHVEVSILDDGCGMTPEVAEHIFEPFYTTKEAGKGTGLGLSISHRIVQSHGGSLEATSPGPGQGSTFRLRLPVTKPKTACKNDAA